MIILLKQLGLGTRNEFIWPRKLQISNFLALDSITIQVSFCNILSMVYTFNHKLGTKETEDIPNLHLTNPNASYSHAIVNHFK